MTRMTKVRDALALFPEGVVASDLAITLDLDKNQVSTDLSKLYYDGEARRESTYDCRGREGGARFKYFPMSSSRGEVATTDDAFDNEVLSAAQQAVNSAGLLSAQSHGELCKPPTVGGTGGIKLRCKFEMILPNGIAVEISAAQYKQMEKALRQPC